MKHLAWFVPVLLVAACAGQQQKSAESAATDVKAKATEVKAEATKGAEKATKAAEAPVASAGRVVCKSGSEERVIEVVAKGNGCELNYTKAGETKAVATAMNGTEHCAAKLEKMKSNLSGAGYKCE